MVEVLISLAAVVGLLGVLVIGGRRRARADLGLLGGDSTRLASPASWVPGQCSFCEGASGSACRVCARELCQAHKPWPAHRFCRTCETEWEEGGRRRAVVLAPLTIVIMLVIGFAIGAIILAPSMVGAGTGPLVLLAFLAPLFMAPTIYLRLERIMRRRFRGSGRLPRARANAL